MQSLPTHCVGSFLLLAAILALSVFSPFFARLSSVEITALIVGSAGLGIWQVAAFGSRTDWRPECLLLLLRYHLFGIVETALILALFLCFIYLQDRVRRATRLGDGLGLSTVVPACGILLAVILLIFVLPRLQRRLRRDQLRLERRLTCQLVQDSASTGEATPG